ncbi:ankyrin repeat domain-containing protein [Ruegeria lacuscaerulensis]|uniref:ankyrin repeat domain-containing protein n=1 Tax=Ruegeria lacuscaerulensis TaxID=55218 RepID=UPI001479A2C6
MDHENNPALKKKLQRLKQEKPLSVDAAMDILEENLGELLDASPNKGQVLLGIRHYLGAYVGFAKGLDCGALPASEVRRVFDQYSVGMFAAALRSLLSKYRTYLTDVLGEPEQGLSVLWKSYTQGRSIGEIASNLQSKIAKEDGTWEKNINRWLSGQRMNISTILEITTKFDYDFGLTLLHLNAYQEYCQFAPVDPAKHRPPFLETGEKIVQDIIELAEGEFAHCGTLAPRTQQHVEKLTKLVDPRVLKEAGDAHKAGECIKAIRADLAGEDRLAGLGFQEGLYEAQLGNLDRALELSEEAAEWFKFRSSIHLKACLHLLLNTAAALGKKRIQKKWAGWCEALGLEVLDQKTARPFLRDFPHPFVEAQNWPSKKPNDGSFVFLPDWETRQPDLSNPNRLVKGYEATPSPQLHFFAHLGQVDKVKALLENGADPEKLDPANGSALLNAIQGGDDLCFETLLKVTSEDVINTRTRGGKSCLHEAIHAMKPSWVKALLGKGANVEIEGTKGQSPLYSAVSLFLDKPGITRGFRDPLVQYNGTKMLPEGLRPSSSPFVDGQAQLLDPITEQYPEIAAAFLDYCADEVLGDKESHREIVLAFLEVGADINAKVSPQGWTPFLYAAEIGNAWLFDTLIDHGASIRDRVANGHTAYTLLIGYGHNELAKSFLRKVAAAERIWLRETRPHGT